MTTSPVSSFFRSLFFQNVGLKLISLVCAVGFYVFIHGGERPHRRFAVPVVTLMPPPEANRTVIRPPPTEIAVTLSGPKSQIDALSDKDLGTVQLDLSDGKDGAIPINSSMFSIPPGLSVDEIFPPEIEVKWDELLTRKIPVQIELKGDPASGFLVQGGVTASPNSVEVKGPRAIVEVLKFVGGAKFDVSGLKEGTQTRLLPLDAPPAQVAFDVEQITATVQVVREERFVPFKAIPVEVVGAPRATTKPPTVAVKVRGSPEVVNSLQADAIVPRVELPPDVDLSKPGSRFLPVSVEVAGATAEVDPPKVLVKW